MAKPRVKTPPPAPDPDWPARVDQFVSHLAEEERSPHTIRNYRDDLMVFASWFREHYGEEPDLGSIAKRDLVEFKQHIEARGGRDGKKAALQTVNRKVSALRALLKWAQGRQLAPHFDPPKPRRRQGPPRPHSLEKAEERALVNAVEEACGPHRARDVAIIQLGLHVGLRVSEMAGLIWSDVKISERKGKLRVRHGKGDKERDVELNPVARAALFDLGYDRHKKTDRAVFEGQRGALKVRAIQDIVEKYAARARVGKRVGIKCSAHTLRHTFGKRLAEKGVAISVIAQLMGHTDPKTTLGYMTSRRDDLADAVEKLAGGDDD